MDVRPTRIGVLGPLRLDVADKALGLGPPKQQAALAILALNANAVVSKDALVDGIWGEDVPATALGNLYTYLSNIRTILHGSQLQLVRASGGYRLDFDVELLDVSRVLELIEQQQGQLDEPEKALASAEEAIGYWRSPETLTGVPGPFAAQRRVEFDRLRQRLAASRARLCIQVQRPDAAADQLVLELTHHPYDEQLASLLITALGLSGRRSEALSFFGEFRRKLVRELGVEPGADVQQACDRIAALERSGPSARAGGGTGHAAPATTFVGRAAEIDLMLAVASNARADSVALGRAAAPVVAVVGAGGIGKSAFAAECARRLADQFGDGLLTVDLNEFGSSSAPLTKAEALHALLRALGDDRIPNDDEARLARYQHAMRTSRRVVVIDNAADVSDISELVNVGPENFVIVTSRDRLAKLVARHQAHRIELPRLSSVEARTLVASKIERDRIGRHRSELIRLCRLCDHLPLALHIAAEQINSRPGLDVPGLVEEFAGAARRLDLLELQGGDGSANSVRAAFLWSYERLHPDAARLLRLLAGLPCNLFTPLLAAAVSDQPLASTTTGMLSLVDHHLLERVDDGFVMHDLTRAFAIEIGERLESREGALTRATIWFITSLHTGHDVFGSPSRIDCPTVSNCSPQKFVSPDGYISWMSTYTRTVAALVPAAHKAGHPELAWKLATLTYSYFYMSGRLTEWVAVLEDGLAAAQACGSAVGQTRLLSHLGVAYSRQGDNDTAIRSYEQALTLSSDDDLHTRAMVLCNLASTLREAGRYDEALSAALDAVPVAEATGAAYPRLGVLDALCEIYAEMGKAELAVTRAQEALRSQETDALIPFEGNLLISLGTARRTLNQFGPARTAFRRALIITQGQRDRYHEALAEFGLARTEYACDNVGLARTLAQRARQHFRELDAEEEGAVAAFLAHISRSSYPGFKEHAGPSPTSP